MKKIMCLIVSVFLLGGCNQNETYSKDLFYMDTYINIKIYSSDNEAAEEALDKIEKMYEEYDQLSDRYTSYDNIININYINNKLAINEKIAVDDRLYDLLDYSKSFNDKTNNLFNITLGNVIDVWATYRDGTKIGVPGIAELRNSGSISNSSLILEGNDVIMKTSDISLDLGAIAKGYVTELAGDYLHSIGLSKYLITAGTSSIKAGDHYNNDRYKIGLTDPNDTTNLYKTIKGNNLSITTSGSYERYYEYEGVRYSHIIDPNTLFPTNYMLSVTVITDDAALGEILSTTLVLMTIDDGLEYLKSFDGVEALWYGNEGKITMTDGMNKYE